MDNSETNLNNLRLIIPKLISSFSIVAFILMQTFNLYIIHRFFHFNFSKDLPLRYAGAGPPRMFYGTDPKTIELQVLLFHY